MRSLPQASREEEPLSENYHGGSCHNWLFCLLGDFSQSGLFCSGFISTRRDVRCGWLVLSVICTSV